jgi:AAA15 family ATPase/GTPase
MRIFRKIEIRNYRNVKHAELKDLRDLNIIIGPNNCGKTNLLEFIRWLKDMNLVDGGYYLCQECKKLKESDSDIMCLSLTATSDDFYLKEPNKRQMLLSISLDEKQIDQLVPRVLKKQKEKLKTALCKQISNNIVLERFSNSSHILTLKHFSIFIHESIIEEIRRNILYCPERRLQSYKEKDFVGYIREKELRSSQRGIWIDFLNKIVDAKIDDEKYEKLIRKLDGEDFETPLSEQGSGVRSLACLAVDILFSDAKIVLIDEPELGLNPLVKQEFLNFLLEESKGRQIFIATQDPTFVNPILWKDRNEKVSVYFYSPIEEKFIKIDLKQNQEDPNTFA